MTIARLSEVTDESRFGGKATQLGAALRARLPVPDGAALSVDAVEALAAGDPHVTERATQLYAHVGGPVAVRSSAIGEDGQNASFAGQHATVLNVASGQALVEAVLKVRASGSTESALAYRKRMGIAGAPRVAVVVQRMVQAECAGVLFSRNPMSGADERVIEASWGLGEAVVAGLITPDRYRVARTGAVLERFVGTKDLAIQPSANGGTDEVEVDEALVHAPCLDDARLRRLHELAALCETHFGGAQDLEWAFVGDNLFLLQRRAITTRA